MPPPTPPGATESAESTILLPLVPMFPLPAPAINLLANIVPVSENFASPPPLTEYVPKLVEPPATAGVPLVLLRYLFSPAEPITILTDSPAVNDIESYLTNGTGAIAESEMPFKNNEDTISISEIQNKKVLTLLSIFSVFFLFLNN